MGRYYNGDIEGKFWFGLQPSNAADRFGVTGVEPEHISYYFEEGDLKGVEDEIKSIEESLGDKVKLVEDLFASRESYNDLILADAGITEEDLRQYADLKLGRQIRDCIVSIGCCTFDAEF